MLIFISCAKTMTDRVDYPLPYTTSPVFEQEAAKNALALSEFSAEELGKSLKINQKIAAENYIRFKEFFSPSNKGMPALGAYTGAVFKRIAADSFTPEDWDYAQNHLLISSFLYGLLRPLDLIHPYRLEGDVTLPVHGVSMFNYWKPLLTEVFIQKIKERGGTLLFLASNEMKSLFDWKKVESEVRVIVPDFQVWKGDRLKTIVIYTKMCRGEMTRFVLKNRLEDEEAIKSFSWEGFRFDGEKSDDRNWMFTA